MSLGVISDGVLISSLQTPDNLLRKNTGNLLAGITPSFSGLWTQQPGTDAEITSEQTAVTLSTPGITTGSATMLWDLGSIQRVIGFTDHEFTNMIMWGSKDYVTWFQLTVTNVASFAGTMRYINMTTQAHASIQYLKVIVYRV